MKIVVPHSPAPPQFPKGSQRPGAAPAVYRPATVAMAGPLVYRPAGPNPVQRMAKAAPVPALRPVSLAAAPRKAAIGKPAVYRPSPALQRKQAPGAPPVYRAAALRIAAPPVYAPKAGSALQGKPAGAALRSLKPQAPATAIQRYSSIMSGKGKLASSGDAIVKGNQLFATAAQIEDSNKKLSAAGPHGAMIKLAKTGAAKTTKESPGKNFFEVVPEVNASAYRARMRSMPKSFHEGMNKQGEGRLEIWADCRRASELVTGSSSASAFHDSLVKVGGETLSGYTGKIERPSNISNDSTTARLSFQVYTTFIPKFLKKYNYDPALFKTAIKGHFPELRAHPDASWVQRQAALAGANISIAERLYTSLKFDSQMLFDREAGINEFANPEIGDAYSTVTEYGMPNFKTSGDDWGFHWGGVVMKAGTDNITLENLSVSQEKVRNTDWFFAMYGTTSAEQTFHQQQLLTGHHGTVATTIAVETVGSRENRQLLALREQLHSLRSMEAGMGADLRPEILKTAVAYNELAEGLDRELVTTYEVLGSDRTFTSTDKGQIHTLKKRWIPK